MSTDITLVGLRIDGVELDIQTLVDLQTDTRSDLENIFPRLAEAENRGANNRWRIENIEIGIALLPSLIATSIGQSSAILEGSIGSIEIALNAARAEANAAKLEAERTDLRYTETRNYIDAVSLAGQQEIQNQFQNDLFGLQDTLAFDIQTSKTQLEANIGEVSASVTVQEAAIATLRGHAEAGYLIKAQAGGAVSLIDLVAADDGVTEPFSIIKIAADDILLEGSVTADSLSVGSVIAEKIGVEYLSAISTDIGVVTAGVIKSTDNKFQINLDAKTITITV